MVTPDQFSTSAIAWITAITTVALTVVAAWAKLLPMAKQIQVLFKLHDDNAANIQKNQEKIIDVALAVTPTPNKKT